jgi:hypothetical protein
VLGIAKKLGGGLVQREVQLQVQIKGSWGKEMGLVVTVNLWGELGKGDGGFLATVKL